MRPDDDELLVAEFEMLELELDERLRVTVDAVLRAGEPEVELWRIDPELLELARLSTIPVRTLQRWTPTGASMSSPACAPNRQRSNAPSARRSSPAWPICTSTSSLAATGHKPRGARSQSPGVRGREWAGGA